MVDDQDSRCWTSLLRAPDLCIDAVREAIRVFGSAADLCSASDAARLRAGIPPAACAFLAGSGAAPRAVDLHWLESPAHQIIPYSHPAFPPLLLALADCPIALYVAGNIAALADPMIAIVGSRNPTPGGRETASALAASLAARGLGIVSGLAEGIDASAHGGALEAQGFTLAVLGTGIDVVYPACNRAMYGAIECHGALVSELPLQAPPRRGHFPTRNRIIAGMSLGTLVVEAASRSGSLITARLSNRYGREVFAVPGSIHSPLSRGCHELIKAGAKLVETFDDILKELNFSTFFAKDLGVPVSPGVGPPARPGMDKDHKILLDALGFESIDLDTLVVRTGFKADAVSSMMLILELEGHVQAAHGGRYSRVAYRRAGGER
ncbi:MAG: DNA-processing protein DprA [Pseudomonadota bacterium]|nr:DNA-processing protein DprA [Pseudomonadota bacterium]